MKYHDKLRDYKYHNNLKYKDIAESVGVAEQTVRNWAGRGNPKLPKISYSNAVKLSDFTGGYITLKDCGYK